MRIGWTALALAPWLAACSLIPEYRQPDSPVSALYPTGPAFSNARASGSTTGRPAAEIGWAQFFTDPVLRDLIGLSLDNNRDLRVAILNVEAARATYQSDRASLLPTIDAGGSLTKERIAPGTQSNSAPLHISSYSLSASAASYELDLFGRIRSQATQADEQYLSSDETRISTQISLVSQIASEYLAWLADRDVVSISTQTAEAQRRSYELRRMTLAQGSGTALDVAQAESTWRTAQASAAQYTRQVAQDYDQIVLLVGAPLPSDLRRRMEARTGLDGEPSFPAIPAGLPSDLLLRRPDIRAAEHTLLAANANIGAARAAFFPAITLTAQGGSGSGSLTKLFSRNSGAWLFEPQISVPIFDAGKNIANLDYAEVEKRVEVANYEKAIQSAFHDVSDALAGRGTYVDQVKAEQHLVDANKRYYDLSKMRADAGADSFLNELVAQNSLFGSQITLVSLRLAERQNLITLYKSLGGGWIAKLARPVVPAGATTSAVDRSVVEPMHVR